MNIVTTRFGLIQAPESDLIRIPDGLVGFRLFTQFVHLPDPVVVAPSLNVQDFIDGVFLPTRHTAYPVVDATGRPLGLVGFRSALDVPREQWATTPVRTVRPS